MAVLFECAGNISAYLFMAKIIPAGAVVTRDIPDYAIVAGNPAKVIRFRNERVN